MGASIKVGAGSIAVMLWGVACAHTPSADDERQRDDERRLERERRAADGREALEQKQSAFFAAQADRDAERTAAHFSEDAVFHIGDMPPIAGRGAIREFYGNVFEFLGATESEPELVRVSESADMAYSVGRVTNLFESEHGSMEYEGKYLVVWELRDETWRIASYSLSANPPERRAASGGGEEAASREGREAREPARPDDDRTLGEPPSPPRADDLDEYVSDLEGEGPLFAALETSMGAIHCRLHEGEAPTTVANFVGLARGLKSWRHPETGELVDDPLYDGTIFHRVIPEFMIQGGDPLGRGNGGPGYIFDNEISERLRHDRPGTLSMANAGPDTNGSQFFITETPQSRLDGDYTVFGHCDDLEVIRAIARVDTGETRSRPAEDVVLESVTISRGER